MNLTDSEYEFLKNAFRDVTNYVAEDPEEPIDPLSYKAPDGDECIHIAVLRGDFRSVELLLKAGVNPSAVGDMGFTPLHYAKKKGFDDIVRGLIKLGADEHLRNDFGKLP